MTGIFGGAPGIGLEIGQRVIRAVGLKKGGGAYRLEWLVGQELPAGLLLDSFTEPNISDTKAFVEALRGLFRSAGHGGGRVGISLPDYVCRISILDFESMQGKKSETEKMIRWRLKKLLPFDVEQASLRYQYLGRFTAKDKDQHRFLVSIIRADILGQYELAFREAGLKPERMDIASFAIWNLFHDLVMKEAGGSAGFAVMNISGGKLTVMVFDKGVLHFLRLKDMGKLDSSETNGEGISVTRVLKELNASLTFYKENYTETPVEKVFMVGDFDGLRQIAAEMRQNSPVKAAVLELDGVLQRGRAAGAGLDLLSYSAACGAALEP